MTDAPERIWAYHTINHAENGQAYTASEWSKKPHGKASTKYTRADLPPKVKTLVLLPCGNGKDDLFCHTQFGMYCVYEIDGGYAVSLRQINVEHQMEDVRVGWAEDRELAVQGCHHDYTSRALSCLVGGE